MADHPAGGLETHNFLGAEDFLVIVDRSCRALDIQIGRNGGVSIGFRFYIRHFIPPRQIDFGEPASPREALKLEFYTRFVYAVLCGDERRSVMHRAPTTPTRRNELGRRLRIRYFFSGDGSGRIVNGIGAPGLYCDMSGGMKPSRFGIFTLSIVWASRT